MFLFVSAAIFAVFAANVVAGALYGSAFAGDVAEMLILFAAVIAFTAGILKREAGSIKNTEKTQSKGRKT